MAELLFRNEVIEASRDRLAGTVIAAVPPSSRIYTRLILALVGLLCLFLAFGSYTTATDVRGIVAYDTGVARVYPRTAAEIAELHVKPGERVQAGQPLVTLAVAQGSGGMASMLDEVAVQDGELQRQLDLAAEKSTTDLDSVEHQKAAIVASLASLRRQKAIAEEQVKLAQSALGRAQRLAAEGAGTQRQVEDSNSNLLQRRGELESINEQIASQTAALRGNEAERSRLQVGAEVAQSELQSRRSQLAEQREQLQRDNRIVLTAPISGRVGDVSLEIGQRSNPDRSIVSIIPENGQLEVWLYAPSKAVGTAHPGQQVRLLFDSFPYQKHGWGTGIVTEVGRVPTEPGNLDPGLQINEPVFRIRTRIASLSSDAVLGPDALRPGMTITAKLEQESQSLWQVFFAPIFQALGG